MADKIATEYYAWVVGGSIGSSPSTTLCVTKSRAIALNCLVVGSYSNNLLVCEKDLSSATRVVVSVTEEYDSVSIGASSVEDVPASGTTGNGIRASAVVTFRKRNKTTYNYGDPTYTPWADDLEIIYGEYVTVNSKGTTISNRTSTGKTSTPTSGTTKIAGAVRTGSAATVYLEPNYVIKVEAAAADYTTHFSYDTVIPASGDTASITKNGTATYTFSSGSTVTTDATNPSFGGEAIYSRSQFTITSNVTLSNGRDVFSVDYNSGKVTALNRPNGNIWSCTVSGILVVVYRHASNYNSGGSVSSLILTLSTKCWQAGTDDQIEVYISASDYMNVGQYDTFTAGQTNGTASYNVTITITLGENLVDWSYQDVGPYAINIRAKYAGQLVLLAVSNDDPSKTTTKLITIFPKE